MIRNLAGISIVTMTAAFPHIANASEITYKVEPLVLSHGFVVNGGSVTTDGTFGALDVSNIVDYMFLVNAHAFVPSPRSSIEILGEVTASSTAITRAPIVDSTSYNSLMTEYHWEDPDDPDLWVHYSLRYSSSDVLFEYLTGHDDDFGRLPLDPYVEFVIARVPEPPPLGDMNGDGEVNFGDLTPFALGLTDIPAYEAAYPDVDRVAAGDINQDTAFNFGDLTPFVELLTGDSASGSAVPEPASVIMAVWAAAGFMAFGRRRVARH